MFVITVGSPRGRNDTPVQATAIDNGSFYATISPYIDPPSNAPGAADQDFYKLISVSGPTVHVETLAQRNQQQDSLDTVIEIVDGNGHQFSNCRQPGDTSPNFSSACLNDDIGGSTPSLDSSLDFLVPGAPSTPTTFYVHVIDWNGNARPDMNYTLNVSGVVDPLAINTTSLPPAARGIAYSQRLSATNGSGSVMWKVTSGALPPGIALSSGGTLAGSATTDGAYSFTVEATDSSKPPQISSSPESIEVVEPVKITSSSTFPDACLNQPYTFAVQTSGGAPPFQWGFYSAWWVSINLDQNTGVFSGTASVTGTFLGTVSVLDGTGNQANQSVSLTVKQCP
jgi:hypothetical protein